MTTEKMIEYGFQAAIVGYLTWQKLTMNKAKKRDDAEGRHEHRRDGHEVAGADEIKRRQ